jgi:16S rRNA (guanine527-N7)-methyltransferase
MQNFEEILSRASKEIDITLGKREMTLFRTYCKELILWNKSISLVSLKSSFDLPVKHFIDSLTVSKFIKNKNSRLLDVGSGAGFPAIPLKILIDPLKITLTDASRKKSSFLKNIIRKLDLDDIMVINRRIEHVINNNNYEGAFDLVTSRATFKLPELLHIADYFLSPAGTLIAMKGKNIDTESIKTVDKVVNLTLAERHDFKLPITGNDRKILIFRRHN